MRNTQVKQAISTAIVAFGLSGRAFHAPFITTSPYFKLRAVVERNGDSSKKQYPDIQLARSLQEVLDNPDIELVVITTPNAQHFPMAKEALLAGKHVVLEKPFTTTLEEARELVILAKKQEKMLAVYQNRRWDGDFLTVRSILDQEILGRLVEYESHFDRFRPQLKEGWKEKEEPGSGILFDLGPHLIDQALCLFGKPQALYADLRKQRTGSSITDAFDLTLEYEGLKVSLKASTLVRAPWPRFLLKGTSGSFIKYGLDPQEAALRAGLLPTEDGWGREEEVAWGELYTDWKGLTFKGKLETMPGNYAGFYENVYQHIREGAPLSVQPEEALEVMELIELALQSAEKGQRLTFD